MIILVFYQYTTCLVLMVIHCHFVFTDTSTITTCMVQMVKYCASCTITVQMVKYCPLFLQAYIPLLPAWSRWYLIVLCFYRNIYHYYLHGPDGILLSFVFIDTSTITTCMVQMVRYFPWYLQAYIPLLPA